MEFYRLFNGYVQIREFCPGIQKETGRPKDRHNIVLPQKLSKIYVISIANIDKTWQYSFQTTDTRSIA